MPPREFAIPTSSLGHSLGLRVQSREALIAKIRRGLGFQALSRLAGLLGVTEVQLAKALSIRPRTLARRKASGTLQADESDRLVRLALLFEEAIWLFEGDEVQAARWFTSPQRALGGAPPLAYADTEPGVLEVYELLGRIEYGILS